MALEAARKRKARTYPELVGAHRRARLVVIALEVGGRWSTETRSFLSQLGDPRLHVCQAPNAFICVSSSVVHFGSILGPFWVHFGVYFGSILGPFWVHFGSIVGPLWVHCGSIVGPFWVHFGSILGPFWGLFWVHFGSILGPFWVHCGSIVGPLWVHCGSIWVHFGSIFRSILLVV